MIRYSTNFMGPIAIQWFRDRGLTREVSHTFIHGPKAGETSVIDEIIEQYAGGRIDVYNLNPEEYHDGRTEYEVAPMHAEDWARFSHWLDHHVTQELWTLDELIQGYHTHNTEIRWASEHAPVLEKP